MRRREEIMDEMALKKYLANGGRIHVIAPRDNHNASHRTRWHFGGVNNYRKQYTRKKLSAAAPGGRIEPGSPIKPRSNQYKKPVKPTVAGMSVADINWEFRLASRS